MAFVLVAVSLLAIQPVGAADYLPPGATHASTAPPIGSGPNPPQPTSGDFGAPPPAPSGGPAVSSPPKPRNGLEFKTQPEQTREYNDYYLDRNDGRGNRGVMRTPVMSGEAPQEYNSEKDILRYERSKYPYPAQSKEEYKDQKEYPYLPQTKEGPTIKHTFIGPDGKEHTKVVQTKMLPLGPEREGHPLNPQLENPQQLYGVTPRYTPNQGWTQSELNNSPVPIVRIFCRKIVKLGVIFATIFMAFAAFSVVLGHRHGGQRVTGTAAGLILLLMGYSIYKVVQINAWRFQEGTNFDLTFPEPTYRTRPLKPANTPENPPGVPPAGVRRSNMPVQPLGASVNR